MRCDSCPLATRKAYKRDREARDRPLIAFVGSSPRSYEVKDGRAFTGQGPDVLRRVLSKLDVDIRDCYFTHAIGCQTPKARKAKVDEVRACAPSLHARLLERGPKVIVAMGDDAVRAFHDTNRAASNVRGRVVTWQGIPVVLSIDPHRVVRVNPRYVASDEVHDATGSPDWFPDLVTDVERAVAYARGDRPLVEDIPYDQYFIADTWERVLAVVRRLNGLPWGSLIAADVETSGLDYRTGRILTLGLCWKPGTGVGIDWDAVKELYPLRDALARHRLVFHNGVFDVPWMRKAGLRVCWWGDTILMHYLTDERPGTHGLERLAMDGFSWPSYESALKEKYRVGSAAASDAEASYENVERGDLLRYNVADCDATMRLWLNLRQEDEDLNRLHDELLMPAAEHFLRLEAEGMLVDREYLEDIGSQWREEMSKLEEELGEAEINLSSHKQVAEYLYDELKLEPMPVGDDGEYVDPDLVLRLTDSVQDPEAQEYFRVAASTAFMKLKPRATSTYMLWWLADQHPWPRALVKYRTLETRYNSYYEGLKRRLIEDRIRPRFRLYGTRTGRLSSTDPNIHGIARDKVIKNIFIADPGYVLVAADYSQAEVRMMAHYARDETLVQALREADIHRAISRRLFGVSEEDLAAMPKERVAIMRRAAKTIIFGLIYGRTPKSLAPQLGVSLEETERYIEELFRIMPEVPKFIQRQQERVVREQQAVSIFGRRRRFPLVLRANASQVRRQGVNMPIQSSVSDMTLMANLEIVRELEKRGARPRVWPHIHDGFVFQVPQDRVDEAVEVARERLLRPPFETDVHFAAEIEVGTRWGSLETVFSG